MIITDKGQFSRDTLKMYGKEAAETDEFKQYVRGLLDNENLNSSLTSMSNQFGMTNKAIEKINMNDKKIQSLSKNLERKLGQIENIGSFQDWLKDNPSLLNLNEIAAAACTVSV